MKMTALLLSLALLAFTATQAQATDKKGRYLILGPGSTSCGNVLADLTEGVKRNNQIAVVIYSNWLAGDLSGYNRGTKNTYSIMGDSTFTDAFEWTLTYCKDHPEAIFSAASDAYVKEFYDDRYTNMPAAGAHASHKDTESHSNAESHDDTGSHEEQDDSSNHDDKDD